MHYIRKKMNFAVSKEENVKLVLFPESPSACLQPQNKHICRTLLTSGCHRVELHPINQTYSSIGESTVRAATYSELRLQIYKSNN